MNPGLLGGLLLPILGAFPDSILILVSGVGGTVQQVTSRFLHSILLLNAFFATYVLMLSIPLCRNYHVDVNSIKEFRGIHMQAQEEVMVGVGVLAGSSVMLLTIAWAGSLIAGRCDLTGLSGTATDLTLTRAFDPIGTGVTTDEQTK